MPTATLTLELPVTFSPESTTIPREEPEETGRAAYTPPVIPAAAWPTHLVIMPSVGGERLAEVRVQLPDNRRFAVYGKEGITFHSLETGTSVVITAPDGSPVPGESISINRDGDAVAFFSNVAGLAEEPDSECPEQMAGGCAWLYIYEVTTESFKGIPVVAVWPPMADTAVSADGRYLAFAAPHAWSQEGVFLYDRTSATLISIHTGDTTTSDFAAGVGGTLVDISADGRFVAFASPDNGIVPEDTNGVSDVFVYDRDTVQIERISTPADDQAIQGPSGFQFVPDTGGGRETGLSISADGRYVVFMSAANLAGGELASCQHWPWAEPFPACRHIYLYDREAESMELISVSADGTPGNGASEGGDVSADGRFVVFTSLADNLVPDMPTACEYFDGSSACPQVYVRDREQGRTYLVSQGWQGQAPDGMSYGAIISDDGRTVVFTSTASNMTPDSPAMDDASDPNAPVRARPYITDLWQLLDLESKHSAIATPYPTQTRTSATATPLPPISWLELSHDDFGVAWLVPATWWEVSDTLLPASDDYSFWSAWTSQEQADQLLSATPPSVPDGLMILSLLVEPTETEAAASGRLRTNVWGQDLRFQELEDGEALPFALRLTASKVRSPYKYTFSLGCAPPDSPDTAEQDAFMATCRYIWDLASHNFGLCALPAPSTPGAAQWKAVGDEGYQYAFEVPAGWNEPGGTPDNMTFFSVPINEQPHSCPAPDQFMKVDFAVQPTGDFAAEGQPAQEGTPDVEGGRAITVAEQPAWLFESGGEAEEGGNFPAQDRLVYIQGPEYWYTLILYCSPAWSADCETVWHHILQSFQISPS